MAAKRAVRSLLRPDSPVHAVLFYGLEGVGKRKLAEFLAQGWLCKNTAEEGPCGVCQACTAFESGQNADLLLVEPRGPSEIIRLDQIIDVTPTNREEEPPLPIVKFARTMPIQSRHKVVFMRDPDRLNEAAQNSLLKILEEPPAYVKFVLFTASISFVAPTIMSRCATVACEGPTTDEMPELAAWPAFGSPASPGFIVQAELRADLLRRIEALAEAIASGPRGAALRHSETLRGIGDELSKLEKLNARHAHAEALRLLAMALRSKGQHAWVRRAIEAHRRILGNANAGVVFDGLFAYFGPGE